jgi:hypothetical protein
MGTAVVAGMSVATFVGVLLTPAFFVLIERLSGRGGAHAAAPGAATDAAIAVAATAPAQGHS